jgi:hypothetical protein
MLTFGIIWLAFGVVSLVLYLSHWRDKPPIWYWPVIILLWPMVFSGGIIHPMR